MAETTMGRADLGHAAGKPRGAACSDARRDPVAHPVHVAVPAAATIFDATIFDI